MDTLSPEESRELLALCKAGKLYQVEEWINQGKSIRVHPKSRDEPLHVALRKEFFSLIELLARHTDSQQTKDQVLLQAVRLSGTRLDGLPMFFPSAVPARLPVKSTPSVYPNS
jgi:hypothetical protein